MPDQSPTNPLTTLLNTTSAKDPGRACFLLHVRPEVLEEFVDVHHRVLEELLDALTAAGWRLYSLFLNPDTGLVVGYFESDDTAAAMEAIADTDVNTRWQSEIQR